MDTSTSNTPVPEATTPSTVPQAPTTLVHMVPNPSPARDMGRASMALPVPSSPDRHADFVYNGKTYTLGHLNGFDLEYAWPQAGSGAVTRFRVRVVFDDHCYTKGIPLDQPYDPAAVVSRTVREVRVIDPVRYQLSLGLPGLIKSMMERTCYFGDQDNFFTVDTATGEKYNVYFTVYKPAQRGGLRLRIQSAYLRPQQDQLQKVAFGLILRNVRDNKPLRPPRR